LSGSRIFGTHWDPAFGEPVPTLGQRDHSFIDLAGTARIKENVFNANLFWMPFEGLAILTGFRYTHDNNDSVSTFLAEEPDKDTQALGQKYTVGATWYPTMRLNLAGQYFHRIASYDEDVFTAIFPRLVNQDWNVDDFNIRMTFRPKLPACMGTLALVTRYDF